ncbi:hypothetical protein F951_02190 [Acinetobacter soli CIP 110264]|uniref:hypothetical protein n=1 Tax=Acinetobacter soli TaxID=487316 RepID=UPI0002CFF943|nr:hypothetical protein [Acinetobacter soli]ENV56492.1 hypothetical protein F951_02190 [Acinetobacter soli CIP 110264]
MFNTETLKLISSSNGEEKELNQCTVQPGNVFSKDIKAVVNVGDVLVRLLPSGQEEKYQILDVAAFTNVLPHYELKVKKL